MNKLLSALDAYAGQTQRIGEHEPIKRFIREHIFYSILDYCGREESAAGRMDMMYHHNLLDKFVTCMRARKTAEAAHWQRKLEAIEMHLETDIAKQAIEALRFPAFALRKYYDKDYDGAVAGLQASLDNLAGLHEKGFPEAIFAIIDQKLNVVRTYFMCNNLPGVLDTALDLLDFLYSRESHPDFLDINLYSYCSRSDYYSVVTHYAGEIFVKVFETRDTDFAEAFYEALAARSQNWRDSDAKAALLLLAALHDNDLDHEAISLSDERLALWRLPYALQYLLAIALLEHAKRDPQDERALQITSFIRANKQFERFCKLDGMIVSAFCGCGEPSDIPQTLLAHTTPHQDRAMFRAQ